MLGPLVSVPGTKLDVHIAATMPAHGALSALAVDEGGLEEADATRPRAQVCVVDGDLGAQQP